MKLLLCIPHFDAATGGAEAFAVSVFRRLRDRGHAVAVAAADGTELAGMEFAFAALPAARARLLETFKPDLVLDWGLNVDADVYRLGGGTHQEFLRLSRSSYARPHRLLKAVEHAVSGRHRRIMVAEQRVLARPEARFLAVSEFVAAQVRRTCPAAADRVTVLYNGVDVARFAPPPGTAVRAQTRAELGLADTDVVCLFVAHNLRLKNFALLRRIFPVLHAQIPGMRLLLLGKRSPRLDEVWFRYAGFSVAPERIYAAADILVHPTYYDACANVLLEALASGLPVVSSDRNGSAEVITPGTNGFVLPVVGAPAAIARAWLEALRRLGGDVELRERLGAAARALAEQHSLERYVDRFEAYLGACPARV